MSATSGEITSVTPGDSSAGTWYMTDLPEPVGITVSTSRPPMKRFIASS